MGKQTQELTQGSLSRHLVRLAVPLVFGNLLQEFYNTIDTFVVGRFAGQEEFAAIATALTQVIAALVCLAYLCRTHRELLLHRADWQLTPARLVSTLKFGLVTSLHQCSLYLGKMFVQGAVNTAGTEVIAAYTAGTRIEGFANSFGSSGSTATSILTAQNYGAGKKDRVEGGFRCSLGWLLALGTLSGAAMYLLAPQASALLLGTGSGTAFTVAVGYLRLVALFYPFCFTGKHLHGVLRRHGPGHAALRGCAGAYHDSRCAVVAAVFGQGAARRGTGNGPGLAVRQYLLGRLEGLSCPQGSKINRPAAGCATHPAAGRS